MTNTCDGIIKTLSQVTFAIDHTDWHAKAQVLMDYYIWSLDGLMFQGVTPLHVICPSGSHFYK